MFLINLNSIGSIFPPGKGKPVMILISLILELLCKTSFRISKCLCLNNQQLTTKNLQS